MLLMLMLLDVVDVDVMLNAVAVDVVKCCC